MTRLILAALALAIPAGAASAQNCQKMGSFLTCTLPDGSTTTTQRMGSFDVTRDNHGNSRTCSWVGSMYVCR